MRPEVKARRRRKATKPPKVPGERRRRDARGAVVTIRARAWSRQTQGWKNYFSIGYPQAAYWEIDWYLRGRLIRHFQRRGQRGFEFPKDWTIFQWLEEQGLIALSGAKAKRHL